MTRSVFLAAIAALVFAACSGGASVGTPRNEPEPDPTIGKYEQTWTTAYGDTTCAHWVDEMDDHQQFVMAGDMLIGLQRDQNPDAFPSDTQIGRLVDAVTTVCDGAGDELGIKVAESVVLLYNGSDDLKPE